MIFNQAWYIAISRFIHRYLPAWFFNEFQYWPGAIIFHNWKVGLVVAVLATFFFRHWLLKLLGFSTGFVFGLLLGHFDWLVQIGVQRGYVSDTLAAHVTQGMRSAVMIVVLPFIATPAKDPAIPEGMAWYRDWTDPRDLQWRWLLWFHLWAAALLLTWFLLGPERRQRSAFAFDQLGLMNRLRLWRANRRDDRRLERAVVPAKVALTRQEKRERKMMARLGLPVGQLPAGAAAGGPQYVIIQAPRYGLWAGRFRAIYTLLRVLLLVGGAAYAWYFRGSLADQLQWIGSTVLGTLWGVVF